MFQTYHGHTKSLQSHLNCSGKCTCYTPRLLGKRLSLNSFFCDSAEAACTQEAFMSCVCTLWTQIWLWVGARHLALGPSTYRLPPSVNACWMDINKLLAAPPPGTPSALEAELPDLKTFCPWVNHFISLSETLANKGFVPILTQWGGFL